ECIGSDHECAGLDLMQGCKNRIEIVFSTSMQDVKLQPKFVGDSLQVLRAGLGEVRTGRVDEESDRFSRGHQLVQKLQPLRPQLDVQICNSSDVAARSGKALATSPTLTGSDHSRVSGSATGCKH